MKADKGLCQICKGKQGDVRGDESLVSGIIMCDNCLADTEPLRDIIDRQADEIVRLKDQIDAYKNCTDAPKELCPDVKCWVQICRDELLDEIAELQHDIKTFEANAIVQNEDYIKLEKENAKLEAALQPLYEHCKHNMQICGIVEAAKQALEKGR